MCQHCITTLTPLEVRSRLTDGLFLGLVSTSDIDHKLRLNSMVLY